MTERCLFLVFLLLLLVDDSNDNGDCDINVDVSTQEFPMTIEEVSGRKEMDQFPLTVKD